MGRVHDSIFREATTFINVAPKMKVIYVPRERGRKTKPKREETRKSRDSLRKARKRPLHLQKGNIKSMQRRDKIEREREDSRLNCTRHGNSSQSAESLKSLGNHFLRVLGVI